MPQQAVLGVSSRAACCSVYVNAIWGMDECACRLTLVYGPYTAADAMQYDIGRARRACMLAEAGAADLLPTCPSRCL